MFRPPFLLLFWDPCLAFVHENGSAKAPQQALLELPEDAEVQLHWGSAPAAGSEWQAIGATGSPGGGGFGWGEKNGKWWVLWNKHSRTSSYMKMLIYIYIYIFTHTHTIYIYTCIYELSGVQESHSLEGERPAQCGAWQSPTEHQSFPTEYPLSDTPIAYPFALLVIYPYVPVDCITVAPVFYLVCPCYIPLQPLNHHFCWLNSNVFLLRLGKTI